MVTDKIVEMHMCIVHFHRFLGQAISRMEFSDKDFSLLVRMQILYVTACLL